MSPLRNESVERLFRAILNLESIEECYEFFEDICTIKELFDISQRLDVAMLLDEGIKYQDIANRVGASTSTISRVNKCYLYGAGGYRKALDRLKQTEEAE